MMSKKWPSNPKYQNVKPMVDSGSTVRRYLENIEELHRNFKYSKDEIFRRIKLDTFVRLVLEVWTNKLRGDDQPLVQEKETTPSVVSLELSDSSADSLAGGDAPMHSGRATTSRSTLNSLICGIGELDVCEEKPERPAINEVQPTVNVPPYLLLDVRDSDDYNRWHIISAINYPHTMLSRVMNYETKDLLAYKNKPGYIIVLYDEDETLSKMVATTLVQRGYDNIYLLSGGLNLAWRRFSQGLVRGSPPKTSIVVTDGACRTSRSTVGSPATILPCGVNEFTLDDLHQLERVIDFYFITTASVSKLTASTGRSGTTPGVYGAKTNSGHGTNRSGTLLTPHRPWK